MGLLRSPRGWWGPHTLNKACPVFLGLSGMRLRTGGLQGAGGSPVSPQQPPPVPSVFQLCHQTYKPFVFAAETLADLSM